MSQTVKRNKYAEEFAPSDDVEQLLADFGFNPAGFKPGQFEATKKAVKKFLDDGDAPDRAVHKAVALHAPGLARKFFRVDEMGGGHRIGGNYQAIDHQNGFFSILDIPIFAEVPAGAKRNQERIGEEWMDKAIEQNRLRRKEGHLPPVHIYHSDETAVKPSYAGKFIITRRGTIRYEGTEIPALFANITDIPKAVFDRIRLGTLPYRSVEVHNWENPEIDSLALMDTDVPFFRMAMTTIGDVRKGGKIPNNFKNVSDVPTMVHWFQEHRLGAAICFRFDDRRGGANMATNISTVKPADTNKKTLATNVKGAGGQTKTTDGLTDQESGTGGEVGPTSGTNTEDQDSMTGLDDGDSGPKTWGDPKVDKNSAPGGTDEEQVSLDDGMGGAPPAGGDPMQTLIAMVTALCQKLGCAPGAAAPASAAPPEAPTQDLAPVSGMRALQAAQVERVILKAVMPLQLEVRKLKADNANLKAQQTVKAAVLKARKALSDEGYEIDEEIDAQLMKAARGGYIDDITAMVRKTQPGTPPETPEAFEQALAGIDGGDEAIKFMAENPGPQNQEWVRSQTREYQAHTARFGSTMTLADWLKTNANYEKGVTRTPMSRIPETVRKSVFGNQ